MLLLLVFIRSSELHPQAGQAALAWLEPVGRIELRVIRRSLAAASAGCGADHAGGVQRTSPRLTRLKTDLKSSTAGSGRRPAGHMKPGIDYAILLHHPRPLTLLTQYPTVGAGSVACDADRAERGRVLSDFAVLRRPAPTLSVAVVVAAPCNRHLTVESIGSPALPLARDGPYQRASGKRTVKIVP